VVTHVGKGRVLGDIPSGGVPTHRHFEDSVLMPTVFDLKRSESACNTCANVNVDLYSACGGEVVIEVVHAIAYCTNATRGLSATRL